MKLRLNKRELGTVLAALRFWQRGSCALNPDLDEMDIATDGGTLDALDDEEIDELYERING
jgi:hypothetical protein